MMKLSYKNLLFLLIISFFVVVYSFVLLFINNKSYVYADDFSNGAISFRQKYGFIPKNNKSGAQVDVYVENAACEISFSVEIVEMNPSGVAHLIDLFAVEKNQKSDKYTKYLTLAYDKKNVTVTPAGDNKFNVSAKSTDCANKVTGTAASFMIVPDVINKNAVINLKITNANNIEIKDSDYTCYIGKDRRPIESNSPWFMTKGFQSYGGESVSNMIPVSLADALDNSYRKDGKPTIEKYNLTGNAEKSKLDTFTGFLGIDGSSSLTVSSKFTKNGSALAQYIVDENNKKNYYYDYLISALSRKSSAITKVKSIGDLGGCTKNCYFRSKTDITIDRDFECKSSSLIVSEGDIIITPDVTVTNGSDGCIFLARNNIVIKGDGSTKKSDNSVAGYDVVNGFLIADGQIIIQDDSDGLEVIGGLVAFGSNGTGSYNSAIVIQRNIKNFNSTNPSVVIAYDPRYSKISSKFFGLISYVYETQDGAKL